MKKGYHIPRTSTYEASEASLVRDTRFKRGAVDVFLRAGHHGRGSQKSRKRMDRVAVSKGSEKRHNPRCSACIIPNPNTSHSQKKQRQFTLLYKYKLSTIILATTPSPAPRPHLVPSSLVPIDAKVQGTPQPSPILQTRTQ